MVVGTVTWPKTTLDAWLAANGAGDRFTPVGPDAPIEVPATSFGSCPSDTWGRTQVEPDERFQHVSVWTGSEMIVWGGFNGAGALATGGRYVPATDSWTSMTPLNAPEPPLGADHKVSPTFTVGLTGGVSFVKDEDTGETDSGFNGGITLAKTFEKGSANLAFTQVTPSTATGETVQYQTVSLDVTRRFGERLNGSAYASYTKYKSLEGDETDSDTANAGESLSYTFAPWASLSLSYAYINFNDKIDSANDYTNNIVILALRLSYSTRPGWPGAAPTPR